MRIKRFTERQIFAVIKAVESIGTIKDVCRLDVGISVATQFNEKFKYSDIEAPDIKKIKNGDTDDILDSSGDETCLLKKKKSAPLCFIKYGEAGSRRTRTGLPFEKKSAALEPPMGSR
ncbi:hypothetical protein G6743_003797 [Escherichia coli]|nr:hypothetical protein [Escherichia coli]HBA7119909.1 hypothetical protein [Escherichia coli]